MCRNMNSTYQTHNLYRKMVGDLGKELERNTSCYWMRTTFYANGAQETIMAAVSTERKLKGQRKKLITTGKCRLSSSSCSSLSEQPFCSCCSTEAWKCQQIPWPLSPPGMRREMQLRGQGSRVKCRFDSVSTAAGSWTPTTTAEHLHCFLFKVILIDVFLA